MLPPASPSIQLAMWKVLLLVSLLSAAALACKSNGACGCCCGGGGGGCGGGCGGGGGGCCRRSKARASKLSAGDLFAVETEAPHGLSIWDRKPKIMALVPKEKITNPNFLFHRCCEERNLPAACVRRCHFNTYNSDVLERMFAGNDACSIDFLPEMQFCAAQGRDHRKCCASSGVGASAAGEKCLTFCDQRPDKFTPVDYSYTPCFDRFESMKTCFFNEIRSEAERYLVSNISLPLSPFTIREGSVGGDDRPRPPAPRPLEDVKGDDAFDAQFV